MEIVYSSRFVKEYRRLPSRVRLLAEKKEKIFSKNQYDPRLKTHLLSGKLAGRFAFSINYQYRILFSIVDENTIWFIDVGTHDIYK